MYTNNTSCSLCQLPSPFMQILQVSCWSKTGGGLGVRRAACETKAVLSERPDGPSEKVRTAMSVYSMVHSRGGGRPSRSARICCAEACGP
jgi:hypothetical protein